MTDHPGPDEATAQRAARSEAELRKLAALLPSIPFYLAPESMSVVMAWAAGEIDDLRAEVATLRADQVSYEKDQEALTRALQEARAERDHLSAALRAMARRSVEQKQRIANAARVLDRAFSAHRTTFYRFGEALGTPLFETTMDTPNQLVKTATDLRAERDRYRRSASDAAVELGVALTELSALRDGRVPEAEEQLCTSCDHPLDRCEAYSARYGFSCALPSGHRWPHHDNSGGGYWDTSGQLGPLPRNGSRIVQAEDDLSSPVDDTGPSVPLDALRALAQGEPLDEVAGDYGVPLDVVKAAAPLVGRSVLDYAPTPEQQVRVEFEDDEPAFSANLRMPLPRAKCQRCDQAIYCYGENNWRHAGRVGATACPRACPPDEVELAAPPVEEVAADYSKPGDHHDHVCERRSGHEWPFCRCKDRADAARPVSASLDPDEVREWLAGAVDLDGPVDDPAFAERRLRALRAMEILRRLVALDGDRIDGPWLAELEGIRADARALLEKEADRG